jgi:aminopeptidase
MADPRVAKLADLLVNYSLQLSPGQIVRIDGGTIAAPLVTELYRSALRAGANPRTHVEVEGLDVIAVNQSSDDQLTFVSELDRFEIEQIDAVVTIWSDRNTRALSQADPQRLTARIESRRPLTDRFWERIDQGAAAWVGTRFPTDAHAQDADMSLEEYEDFAYGACHVQVGEDPVAHWRAVSIELNERARELDTFRELRIVGSDTDLRVGVEGRSWLAADGRLNMPDGESSRARSRRRRVATSAFRFRPSSRDEVSTTFDCGSRTAASRTPKRRAARTSFERCSTWTTGLGSSVRCRSA